MVLFGGEGPKDGSIRVSFFYQFTYLFLKRRRNWECKVERTDRKGNSKEKKAACNQQRHPQRGWDTLRSGHSGSRRRIMAENAISDLLRERSLPCAEWNDIVNQPETLPEKPIPSRDFYIHIYICINVYTYINMHMETNTFSKVCLCRMCIKHTQKKTRYKGIMMV